ncbi:RNA-binding protein, putative [Plasmodium malariae]|uniref:RNA-binding protein, putative n=1 Tax=Plasmodium malariae TaxID=5858 RepID=A0A1D3TDB0_PLAMA|nr:RNA-binding protein, putative [Plasmodium malariae]SCP02877.1 RNA-binding protein, putative [Plasmodium malariae]
MSPHKDNNDAIDKHKVFVRNINENDVEKLSKEFEKVCSKLFFFRNRTNSKKSAICYFKSEKEAKNFITKYNDVNTNGNTSIKCEYAFKKKYEQKKLISITYKRQKINYTNAIKIYTDYDIDSVLLLSYLKNIFLLNRNLILRCLDEISSRQGGSNKIGDEKGGIKNDEKSDASLRKSCNVNSKDEEAPDDDIEIVVEKKDKKFEEIVLNIDRKSKIDNKTRRMLNEKLVYSKKREDYNTGGSDNSNAGGSDNNNASSSGNNNNCNNSSNSSSSVNGRSNLFVYAVEFLNINVATQFFRCIDKASFLKFVKENDPNVRDVIVFFHELCYLNKNNRKVILKNLSRTCHIENIKKLFRNIEEDAQIVLPKKKNKKQGYAYVTFSCYKNVQKALLLNKSKLCGNVISIERIRNLENPSDAVLDVARGGVDEKEGDEINEEDGDEINEEDGDKVDEEDDDKVDEEDDDKVDEIRSINRRTNANDVEEGKTLFITNVPLESTEEEIRNYVVKNINKNYVYIKTCRNNSKRISVFVKLKRKEDAENFLKKIGELNEEETAESHWNDEENVIHKFYSMKKKKKEKMKQLLLKDNGNNKNSEILFFKNNYLMIKRAVRKDLIEDKKKFHTEEKNKKKKKMSNNIHLLYDNNVNNDYISESLIKRNKKLMEKKEKVLKNKNFFINPCRIYIRNYPSTLEQNLFRQLITRYFTPIFMKKYNIKKKDAFKKSNEVIKKMKVIKEPKHSEQTDDGEGGGKIKNIPKKISSNSSKNNICFIDINKHEYAKELIHLLQNKNIYELINEIIYKKKYQTIRRNKNIMYVDYCIEDIRMLHIKKLKTEKFLKHIKEKNGTTIRTKKIIKKKKNKISRGKRQREKRRLLKMQTENTNIVNVINSASLNQTTQLNFATGTNSINKYSSNKMQTKEKINSKQKYNNQNEHANTKLASKKKKTEIKEKKIGIKKTNIKTTKDITKKSGTKNGNKLELIQKDVLNFLRRNKG